MAPPKDRRLEEFHAIQRAHRRILSRSRRRGRCLLWTGSRNGDGYGTIRVGRKVMLVHRVAWEALHGPIPLGLKLRHSCDRPLCHDDAHLLLGTQGDNVADMARKNRGTVKLTLRQVRAIRRMAERGQSCREIALRFGITAGHAHKIATGRRRQYA